MNKWIGQVAKGSLILLLALGILVTGSVMPLSGAQAASKAARVISEAKEWRGYPYRFGADGLQDRAFDCSSFTRYVFRKVGVYLPRTSRAQARVGKRISRTSSLKAGDLLFFDASSRRGRRGQVDHVGIYIGGGKFIHTYRRGIGVTISTLSGSWRSDFLFARRVL